MENRKEWTATEMNETFGELLNSKVRAIHDIWAAARKGKKRQVKVREGQTAACFDLYLNRYSEPLCKLRFADGEVMTVNPKHLEVVKTLSKGEVAELAKFKAAQDAERAEGQAKVTIVAQAFDRAENSAYLRVGSKAVTVPLSLIEAKPVKGTSETLVDMPLWLVRQRFGEKADDLIAKGKARKVTK